MLVQAYKNYGKILQEEKKSLLLQIEHHTKTIRDLDKQYADFALQEGSVWHTKLQTAIHDHCVRLDRDIAHWRQVLDGYEQQMQSYIAQKNTLEAMLQGTASDAQVQKCLAELDALLHIPDTTQDAVRDVLVRYIGGEQLQSIQTQIAHIVDTINTLRAKMVQEDITTSIHKLEEEKKLVQKDPRAVLDSFFTTWTNEQKAIQDKIDMFNKDNSLDIWQAKLTQTDTTINQLMQFLQDIQRKELESIYTQYTALQQEQKVLDTKLQNLMHAAQQTKSWELEKASHQAVIQQLSSDIQSYTQTIIAEKEILLSLQQSLQTSSHTGIIQQENIVKSRENSYTQICQLLDDYGSNKLKVKQLIEDEKMINDLYVIFSKELLLLVLSESLPVLADIINIYLAQVVDYQLKLHVT